MVNEEIPLPESPGPWVDQHRCVCQAHPGSYVRFNSHVSFEEAAAELREWNKDNDTTDGGWRSQGPVLHMMRVIKLRRWYEAHGGCNVEIPSDPDDWPELVWELYDQAVGHGFDGDEYAFAELNNEEADQADDDDLLATAADEWEGLF